MARTLQELVDEIWASDNVAETTARILRANPAKAQFFILKGITTSKRFTANNHSVASLEWVGRIMRTLNASIDKYGAGAYPLTDRQIETVSGAVAAARDEAKVG